MERLTCRTAKGPALIMGASYPDEGTARADLMERYKAAIAKLAAYEDTGLYPGEIELYKEAQSEIESMSPSRMLELIRAEKGGRLVALPCKVGDVVHRVFRAAGREPVIIESEIKTIGQAADLAGRIGKDSKFVSVYKTRQEAEDAVGRMKGEHENE